MWKGVVKVEDEKLATCAACGGMVARSAAACPHCGGVEKVPILMEPPWNTLPLSRRVYWVFMGIAACLIGAGMIWQAIEFVRWLAGRVVGGGG